jgi:hypothetical protein
MRLQRRLHIFAVWIAGWLLVFAACYGLARVGLILPAGMKDVETGFFFFVVVTIGLGVFLFGSWLRERYSRASDAGTAKMGPRPDARSR